MKKMTLLWLVVALGCAVVGGLVAGCNDNELGIERRTPNRPPETTLSGGPRDSTTSAVYRVDLRWSGTDPDGAIDHYDFIMVDHPRAVDNIDGRDSTSVLVLRIPQPEDPRWIGTTANDSVFIALADTLRGQRPGPAEDAILERWHTFFVRAVDDEGTPDPTPDYVSFNAVNVAPVVSLQEPVRPREEFVGPPVIVFNWDGEDAVGDGNTINPVASRWVIIEGRRNQLGVLIDFPDALYRATEWSAWRRWDALDGSGKRAIVRGLRRLGETDSSGVYFFAVQAMDEAGAITPIFDASTNRRNNAVGVLVNGRVGAVLTLRDDFLGVFQFTTNSRPVRLDIAAGQPLQFRWLADATTYGGEIDAYRYGWDLRDPNDDQEWDVNWSSSLTMAAERIFIAGEHTFFLQARDNAGTITQARLNLTVHQVSRARDLLWVDDSEPAAQGSTQEVLEDQRWLGAIESLALERNFEFNRGVDVYDVVDNNPNDPPLQLVFGYKTVVWTARGGSRRGATALQNIARFADPFAERNQDLIGAFNYLNIYLKNKGELWISGFRVANTLWPPQRHNEPGEAVDPVNVTNWNDPVEPHPFVDSVGTTSLLYQMGIEMFDCGSATDCVRATAQNFCKGIARAVPPGSEIRAFQTTGPSRPSVLAHVHQIEIPSVDVERMPAESRTYTSSSPASIEAHTHALTISATDFDRLRSGEVLTLETALSEIPLSHTHEVEVRDNLGLWGAPALQVGPGWDQAPGFGRTNNEIYNMPAAMASQRPGDSNTGGALAGRSFVVTLYTFVSSTPENPDADPPLTYPRTADRQPIVILAKGSVVDPTFNRCFLGFEPEGLTPVSHRDLLDFILVRHFGLGGDGAN